MIKLEKLLHHVGKLPYHRALLVGLWVFLGCSEVDENGVRKPFVFSPPPKNNPPQAEDYTMTSCPAPEGCFDVSFWSNYKEFDDVCDVETITLNTDDDVVHCAAGIESGDGSSVCWWEETGEIVVDDNFGPVDGCDSFFITGGDANADGQLEPYTAVNGSIHVAFNTTTTGKPTFGGSCEVATTTGDVIDVLGCSGSFCRSLQVVQPEQTVNFAFTDSEFDCDSANATPVRTTPGPPGTIVVGGAGGDINNDGFWDYMSLFFGGTPGSCTIGIYFGDASGDTPPVCGGFASGVAYCSGVAIADVTGDDTKDWIYWGSTEDSEAPDQVIVAEGNLDTPGSACTDGLGFSNDQTLVPTVAGRIPDVSVCPRGEDANPGLCVPFTEANAVEIWVEEDSPPPPDQGPGSPLAGPAFVRDPLGPYPTGGSPDHILIGRDINRDGLPEVLTVNSNPRNYTVIFSSVDTEPDPLPLDGRVTADEPWQNNEEAMPVGLISDLMVVGIPKDTEAAGSSTGAVFSFKREGKRWVQQQKILPENPQQGMRFGYSLSVEEQIDTGEAWLVVGARTYNDFEGRVDFYQRSGDNWVYHSSLENSENDFLGWDVDINVDIPVGQEDPEWTAAIGAPSYRFEGKSSNTGAVFISYLNGQNWTPPAIPLNSDSVVGNNPGVGTSVAIDGDVIIAGAPRQRVDGNNGAGAVYIFSRGEISPWVLSNEILNPNPRTNEINGANFGHSVDVVKQVVYPRAPTGNYYYLVGAPRDTSEIAGGEVYIFGGGNAGYQRFRRPGGGAASEQFGHAVAFRDDLIGGNHYFLASTSLLKTGGAYLYDQPDFPDPWGPIKKIAIPGTDVFPASTAIIGEAVAAWSDFVAVSTSNLSTGNDAIYTDLVPIMFSGFEGDEN